MPLKLASTRVEGIPPLAWTATLGRDGDTVTVQHGTLVETFLEGFFEGAWDGDFAKGEFAQATNVFGSGGALVGDGMLFLGPSHTLEPLYIAETRNGTTISNSLAFLLRKAGLEFDLANDRYGRAFSEIVHGLEHTPQTIELDGGRLTLLYHHNLLLQPDGRAAVTPKPLPPSFPAFADYRDYLRTVVRSVFGNAGATGRSFRYAPIATVSSGYDSAASAVIARDCGCAESLSLSTSSVGFPDSGRAVATALGMAHSDFERVEGGGDPVLEAEFLATGMQGEDYVYAVFGERIAGRILVTGFQGGRIWSSSDPPNPNIKRSDLSGCSLGEFRLRTNFLHLPLAFIGIQRHADLHRISNAPDMRPYAIRRSYDRPLPRRILEGAGVDRDLFAQRKQGASILLFQGRNRLSPAVLSGVADYCRSQRRYPGYGWRLALRQAWWTTGRNLYRLVRHIGRGVGVDREGGTSRACQAVARSLFGLEYPVFGASHPRFTLLLMWAIATVQPRYAAADGPEKAARAREIA